MIDPLELFNQLEQKRFSPIYFLFGEEPFFIDEAVELFENLVLSSQEKDLNQVICYGKEITINEILSFAKRFPLMSDKQLIIIKEAQELYELDKDVEKYPPLKNLEIYLSNPLPSTILVFCYKDKINSKKSVWKMFSKYAIVCESKRIYDRELESVVRTIAHRKNIRIKDDAVKLLVENVGNNLSRLINELTKVKINLIEKEEITTEHIEKYVGISRMFNTFEYQKALAYKDETTAFKIAIFMGERAKEYPINVIIKSVFDFFSSVLLCYYLKLESIKDIQKNLEKNFFQANDIYYAMKNYSLTKLFLVFKEIQKADLKSKGINSLQSEKDILLEMTYGILR
jgi:DNA polymerase-3 subunit delta